MGDFVQSKASTKAWESADMVKSFNQSAILKRPNAKSTYNAKQTYITASIANVKIAQPTKAWTVSREGAMQSLSATLYYNLGTSEQTPVLAPLFKEGDNVVYDGKTYIVQSVTEQWLKGALHHYEVALA